MFIELFASPIYVHHIQGTELEMITQEIDRAIAASKDSALIDQRRHNVITNYHDRPNWIIEQQLSGITQMITEALWQYQEQLGLKEPMKLDMIDSWYNIYSQGGYMSEHEHPGTMISGVYYHRAEPECGGSLWFRNPNFSQRLNLWPSNLLEEYLEAEVPAQTGRLVLFPSWLSHSVGTVNTEKISISFNLGTK